MENSIILMIGSLCVLLAGVETLQGIFRAVILVPKIGKKKALKVSAFTGSVLAYLCCYIFVPGIGFTTTKCLLILGLVLAVFMASFDILIGKLIMKMSWPKILSDFNPANGNYLSVVLLLLVFYPILVTKI